MPRVNSQNKKTNIIPYQQVNNLIALLDRTSMPCEWEQAVLCPCLDPSTAQPRSNCPHCHGRGVLYRSPIEVHITLQNNAKDAYNGQDGTYDRGTVVGTPQVAENAITNGISYRDRITVIGATLTQSYIVSINEKRIGKGIRMPYDVVKIDHIETFVDDVLTELTTEQYSFDYTKNLLTINDKNLINQNVTLSLSVSLRYYVSDILKEYRNAQISKKQTIDKLTTLDDETLTYNDGREPLIDNINGATSFRMPKKLILKREDFFIPIGDLTTEGNTANTTVTTTTNTTTDTDTGIIEDGNGTFVETRDRGDQNDISWLWGN